MIDPREPRLTAAEATRNFGRVRELAIRAPVVVTHHGRDKLAILSMRDYATLQAGPESPGDTVQRQKLMLILDGISEGYVSLDPEWRYVTINRVAELFLGQPREALIGRILPEAFPQIRGTRAEAQLRRAMDHGEEVSFDWGSLVHRGRRLHARAFPLPAPSGGIGILFSNLGATERLETQERLQRTGLRHLLAELPGWAVFAYDGDGTVMQWPESAASVLGWTEAEILGQSIEPLFTAKDRAAGRPWSEMSAARRDGRSDDRIALLHRDGAEIPLRSILLAPPDCPGDFLRIVTPPA
ncbi:PAS domain-containing protein [uncultured Jannaschia sp.]|uniref:PAS domain-containing protein n=1 Tax=uncultured Jannaschia sp. TaxID=293347 RepID=UPI0026274B11|nr:PAS domain-containing protein [uncultured Jannaschia sp.]